MFALRLNILCLAALLITPFAQAGVLPPRPSSVPCTATCPTYDDKGWPLQRQQDTGDNIKCTYSDRPNHTRNCFYDETTGDPKAGNDRDCPNKARTTCPPSRRKARGIYQAYQSQRKRRASQPAPSVPDYMKKRSALKKRDTFRAVA